MMGIEYAHFLVVADKDWHPQEDTLERVDAVLRKWSLVNSVDKVFDLSSMTEASGNTIPHADPGAGVAVAYRDSANGESVERIAGPSYYDTVKQEHRYLSKVVVVAGEDFRIQKSDMYCYFELVAPTHAEDVGRGPESDAPGIPWPVNSAFFEYLDAKNLSHPPTIQIHLDKNWSGIYDWSSYAGYWRGGVVLDFGKDLPGFVEKKRELPSREFVDELSTAFRGPIVEVGEIY